VSILLLLLALCATPPEGTARVDDVQLDLWLPEEQGQQGQAAKMEIRSERFDLDTREGTGVFAGAVVVTFGSVVVTCDRLEVAFDQALQTVRTAVASGGVEIRQGARLRRGERAEFEVEPGTVLLSGEPYLEQGNVRLQGTTIRFDVGGGEVACTGCRAVFGERP